MKKTFKDLKFEPHHVNGHEWASLTFDNGFGISVITGPLFYSNGLHDNYEIAMLDKDGNVIYTSITNHDVVGYLSKDEVTEYMSKIQTAQMDIKRSTLWDITHEEYLGESPKEINIPLTPTQEQEELAYKEAMKDIDKQEAKLQAERDSFEQSYIDSLNEE